MSGTRQIGAELLVDVAGKVTALAKEHGMDDDRAARLGTEAASRLAEDWGGQQVYIPMDLLARNKDRNAAIYREFTGDNVADLASKHGLSIQAIYRIIKAERAARSQKQHLLI
jgi:Mor family transcriptional regulator